MYLVIWDIQTRNRDLNTGKPILKSKHAAFLSKKSALSYAQHLRNNELATLVSLKVYKCTEVHSNA